MKTIKNNKLDFRKSSITELNDDSLNNVKGGTTPTSFLCGVSITIGSIAGSVVIVGSILYTVATRK